METPSETSSTLPRRLRKDTENTDVDLVFEGGVVLAAHASVLALGSDYYKEALSEKWTHARDTNESYETGIGKGHSKSTGRKITLSHPDVDVNTAKIVLDFLYLGDVEIPPSLISRVIAFADEILVVSLVQKCVDYVVNENKLSSEHALECYVQFDRVHAHVNSKSYALSKMLQNLPLSLECGRAVLEQMNEREVETLLLFELFEPLDRWRILIAWCKACQDTEGDLSLESKLADNFPIEAASELIKPLLPVVELFKIPDAHFSLLEPFQVLLPKLAQDLLAFHLKGKTRSGGNQWKATHQNLMEIMRAIKQYLPATLLFHNVAADPVLLFHGKPGTIIERDLHEACDDHPNTLTLVKIKNGNIFGRFLTHEWSTCLRRGAASFMFVVGPNGMLRILSVEYESHRCPYGLNVTSFMKEFAMVAEKHKDIFSGFGDGGVSAFIKQHSAIEYIKVYQIN
ncbi:hypothetical protein HDU77_000669 [Chytriomyces hyalinus]|nr:hypothetical protein HDU77_000669 [Chytriomyces hyalinus]